MNSEVFFSQISSKSITPISKNLKQNQIHNDYTHCLSSTGYMIASSSVSTPFKSELSLFPDYLPEKKLLKSSTMNCIEKAIAARASYKPENVIKEEPEGLYFSKKPRFVEYTPYSARDYNEIKKFPETGGLGAWRIGSLQWENERTRRIRMKTYSQNLKNLHK
ncbi:hypothetical protein SteCoe_15227 [Stentor coeruleus]|uniref:Uncharacterized protein n=1 Tax=Stentor coeruleus TaxID=5963 RepID=A0A1R2C480_9CILI|nr:hypothetical protein SteCoe_15227 [Stentor coeruleus]